MLRLLIPPRIRAGLGQEGVEPCIPPLKEDPRLALAHLVFTFRQVGVEAIIFQALPGPEARALCAKIMREARRLALLTLFNISDNLKLR